MLKISKLTITSIFSGYPDLVKTKCPEAKRAATLIKERMQSTEGILADKVVPEYMAKPNKSCAIAKTATKSFIG